MGSECKHEVATDSKARVADHKSKCAHAENTKKYVVISRELSAMQTRILRSYKRLQILGDEDEQIPIWDLVLQCLYSALRADPMTLQGGEEEITSMQKTKSVSVRSDMQISGSCGQIAKSKRHFVILD